MHHQQAWQRTKPSASSRRPVRASPATMLAAPWCRMQLAAPACVANLFEEDECPAAANSWAATGLARALSRPEVQYACALARMPTTLDGDHGSASAASSHARRTAGAGAAEKIQNLSSADRHAQRSLRVSPHPRPTSLRRLMLARSAPMGLDHSGSIWVFQDVSMTLHELKEVREVSCSESGGRPLRDRNA